MSDYKITREEYEDAQNVVWDYEEQLKAEANGDDKDHEPSINYDGVLVDEAQRSEQFVCANGENPKECLAIEPYIGCFGCDNLEKKNCN